MLIDNLKKTINQDKDKPFLFLRNLLKEQLQYYVLEYIYGSDWGKTFLFKGGTCLRFCFGLNRLSEDLDFDIENYRQFDLGNFVSDLENYFAQTLQIKEVKAKITNNQQQVLLRFPVMEQLNLRKNNADSNILMLRLDLQGTDSQYYNQEVSLISQNNFNFVVRRYSLADLFSSKITAILKRSFFKGKENRITFKGRDYFDLIWFLQQGVEPNLERLKDLNKNLSLKEISDRLNTRVKSVKKSYLKEDLQPLFDSATFVNNFTDNFFKFYQKYQCPNCQSIFTKLQSQRGVGAGSETDLPQITKSAYKCLVCGEIFTAASRG